MHGVPAKALLNTDYLRSQAHWIRDALDPVVARDGPEALHVNDVLTLDELLRKLLITTISVDEIRCARMHLAILDIAGLATRWPTKLIERAEAIIKKWEAAYGLLKELGTPLYGPGGRLHGIAKADDLSKERLLVKWLKAPGLKVSPVRALRFGDLGFKPGHWWITPIFAFLDGIIDRSDPNGGIVADGQGAYAILMTGDDEVWSSTPEKFTYRARVTDKGRYRLTAATPESRQPIRVLRSHTLRSFWSPRAGLRYDGLHRVISWSISTIPQTRAMVYDITFERLTSESSMDTVLCRPWADEVEDYKEYKRLRKDIRVGQAASAKAKNKDKPPPFTVTVDGSIEFREPDYRGRRPALSIPVDGTIEVFEDETAETPRCSDTEIPSSLTGGWDPGDWASRSNSLELGVHHDEVLSSATDTSAARNALGDLSLQPPSPASRQPATLDGAMDEVELLQERALSIVESLLEQARSDSVSRRVNDQAVGAEESGES